MYPNNKQLENSQTTMKQKIFMTYVRPAIEQNWNKFFEGFSVSQLKIMVDEMLQLVITRLPITNCLVNKQIGDISTSKIFENIEEKSDETKIQIASKAHVFNLKRKFVHAHCLNPIAIFTRVEAMDKHFGLRTSCKAIAQIHEALSDGLYLQIKDILGRSQKMFNHRIKTGEYKQPIKLYTSTKNLDLYDNIKTETKFPTTATKTESKEKLVSNLTERSILDRGLARDMMNKWASWDKKIIKNSSSRIIDNEKNKTFNARLSSTSKACSNDDSLSNPFYSCNGFKRTSKTHNLINRKDLHYALMWHPVFCKSLTNKCSGW